VTRIGESCFAESALKSIVIPQSVEELANCCFSGCTALAAVTFQTGSRLKRIVEPSFSESSVNSVYIPPRVQSFLKKCFGKSGFETLASETDS
jgi:hypothetical protein